MRKILVIFPIFFGTLITIFFLILLYTTDEKINNYKKTILGSKLDYIKLKTDYESYKKKTENLRQITVLNNNPDSKNKEIARIIDKFAQSIEGDLSIYYKNLGTNENVVIDGDRKYYMASLYKVILTLYILEQIKENKLTLDDKISSGSAITIENALNKIVTESNNEYAQELAEKYGWFNIEAVMKEKLGIEFSFNTELETTIRNIEVLFENIALSLKISDMESKYLLKLLADQKKTSKLPKYLPKNIYSHNKTGEFETYSHDAGIFYTPKANYILIFMSSSNYPDYVNEQMALMSKEIYGKLNN